MQTHVERSFRPGTGRLASWRHGGVVLAAVGVLSAGGGVVRASEEPAPPLYALIVGGGPDQASNAAQIEGHVRFVAGLLPPAARRSVLFADGEAERASVVHSDTSAAGDARRALAILLADKDADEPTFDRAPKLDAPLEGPARLANYRHALGRLTAQAGKQPAPLLLYFAGHGTQDEKDERNTAYDLWDGDTLTVKTLADELARVPRPLPVVLVMAQCFSGAFADVLFTHGDPKGTLTGQNVVGFFSAQKDREAAGCSFATERADYQDFSSYFFGALSGHDRFGGSVSGADYDGNGRVSLHEAFCYALIHDPSADTPVCTSDVFLQTEAGLADETIYGTPYREAWREGTPAQRAVLDALSERLGLEGEARAVTAYDRLTYGDPAARPELVKKQVDAKERLGNARREALGALFERWPALRWGEKDSAEYKEACDGAVAELSKDKARRRALLDAGNAAEQADEALDDEEAALTRFANLYEHLVEASHLRAEGERDVVSRFENLWKAEQAALPLAEQPRGSNAP